jgi:hypothetical protein
MSKRALVAVDVLAVARIAPAAPTTTAVRVIAKNEKFVGFGVGRAEVELRRAETGELLASDLTAGGRRRRHGDEDAASSQRRLVEQRHRRPLHHPRHREAPSHRGDCLPPTVAAWIREPRMLDEVGRACSLSGGGGAVPF